jgi:hypothetical protein
MNKLSNVVQYNHTNAYKRLFMLTTCVLPRLSEFYFRLPMLPDYLNIEFLLQKWKEPNGPRELFALAQRRSAESARLHTDNPNHDNATRAINTLRRGGRLSKSMQQLTSSGLALNQMKSEVNYSQKYLAQIKRSQMSKSQEIT